MAAPREEVEGLVSPAGHRPDASEPERGDDGESDATVRLGFAESGFELALGLVELVPLPLHAGPCQPGLGKGGMVGSVEVHVHQRLVGQSLGLVQMSFDEMDLRQGGGCQEPVDGLWHLRERVETPTRSPRRLGVVQPPPRAHEAVGKAIEVAVVGIGTVPIDRIVRPADGTWCICDEVRPHGPVTSQSRLLDLVRLLR